MDLEDDVDQLRAAIARLARQLNLGATQVGLTPSQASALALIVARGPLGVAELAELEQVNPSMVSRIVGKLVAAGLIERNPGLEDGRTALVNATAHGRSVVLEIKRSRTAELRRALESLSPADRNVIQESTSALARLGNLLRAQAPRHDELRSSETRSAT